MSLFKDVINLKTVFILLYVYSTLFICCYLRYEYDFPVIYLNKNINNNLKKRFLSI